MVYVYLKKHALVLGVRGRDGEDLLLLIKKKVLIFHFDKAKYLVRDTFFLCVWPFAY